jgi:hypothetical protein
MKYCLCFNVNSNVRFTVFLLQDTNSLLPISRRASLSVGITDPRAAHDLWGHSLARIAAGDDFQFVSDTISQYHAL